VSRPIDAATTEQRQRYAPENQYNDDKKNDIQKMVTHNFESVHLSSGFLDKAKSAKIK
jgi:hypothetical protein